MNKELLVIENLTIKRNGHDILRNVHLKIQPGKIHGLLGLNGSGKSSLAYALMGCKGYEPDEGLIEFDGKEITHLPINERAKLGITLAWQEPARFEGLPVGVYLALGAKDRKKEAIESALEAVALPPAVYLKRPIDRTLSGGERKRIELAAVYLMQPRLAILDEPDSGIDMLSLSDVISLAKSMAKNGSAILLITHRDEMVEAADNASLMCRGTIIYHGTANEVREYFRKRCRIHSEKVDFQPVEKDMRVLP